VGGGETPPVLTLRLNGEAGPRRPNLHELRRAKWPLNQRFATRRTDTRATANSENPNYTTPGNAVVHAKGHLMTLTKAVLALACLISNTLVAQEARVTPLLSKDLTNLPGKEGLMITVEYPPGSSDPIHRHYAHAFVYVLEGSIVMQVRGGRETTLTPGQTFYEGLNDVHIVGRNASQTQPAKFVVFLVKDKGAPVVIPAK
jgi:quercetin dioxygenase-like cupin family protein